MPKVQKQKANTQVIMLFQRKTDLVFFKYESNHPKRIDIEQFYIGKFRIFRDDKIYFSELKSKPNLNPSLNWNAETFSMLIKKLEEFRIEEQNIDLSQHIFLSVYLKVKGRDINLMKLRLVQEFGINVQNQLWNQFQKYNAFKSRSFQKIQTDSHLLNEKIEASLDRLQDIQNEERQKVDEVKGKLSVLLNQKQNKLLELSGNKSKFTYKLGGQDDKNEKNIESGVVNWMSSQDDRMLVGSFFAPSQQYTI